jgi:hypothetical protein
MKSTFLKALKRFEKQEKRFVLVELFSTGTVSFYTFTSSNDRKWVRDFTSLIELENWLNGQEVRDYSNEVQQA